MAEIIQNHYPEVERPVYILPERELTWRPSTEWGVRSQELHPSRETDQRHAEHQAAIVRSNLAIDAAKQIPESIYSLSEVTYLKHEKVETPLDILRLKMTKRQARMQATFA
jgi:hypothetical protein